MSKRFRAITILCLLTAGCGGYDIAQPDEAEALTKIRSGECELVKKDEVADLRKQAEQGRMVGRYELISRGFRTWRLDTATGRTCIVLTTEADWKKAETMAQACSN